MIDSQKLLTASLRSLPNSTKIAQVLAASLEAADPLNSIRKHVARDKNHLIVGKQSYDLSSFRKIYLIGIGKASIQMAQALIEFVPDRPVEGVVIAKNKSEAISLPESIEVVYGGHPVPDERSVLGGSKIKKVLEGSTRDDLVICLISGGGSALMTSPLAGISIADIQWLTSQLLACGASIDEMNAIRKHLDELKGGGLVKLAHPSAVVTLILSDVVGSPLSVIASGPTVADPTTFAGAIAIIEKYDLLDEIPLPILRLLRDGCDGKLPETVKPGSDVIENVHNVIVGNNYQAAQAALDCARRNGYNPLLLTAYLQGEASQAGRFLAALARQIAETGQPIARPACIVAGGETTVTIKGKGLGGRNQEVALGAVGDLAGVPGVSLVTLATDGEDGPTDAAGAVATGQTLSRAAAMNLNWNDFLKNNDAYHFFEALDDLIRPGPTGTNVNDLSFLFLEEDRIV